MKVFHWKVRPGMEVSSAPRVKETRFGDGYSQRAPAGLNADLKTYRVAFSPGRREAMALEDFLSWHGGVKAFLWTPPQTCRQIRVVCSTWTSTVNALRVDVRAEFRQVVA